MTPYKYHSITPVLVYELKDMKIRNKSQVVQHSHSIELRDNKTTSSKLKNVQLVCHMSLSHKKEYFSCQNQKCFKSNNKLLQDFRLKMTFGYVKIDISAGFVNYILNNLCL